MKYKRKCNHCGSIVWNKSRWKRDNSVKKNCKCKNCASIGRKHTEKWKRELSKKLSGRKMPEKTKKKISKSHLNNPKKAFMQTEEYKKKISKSLKRSKIFQKKMKSKERREKLRKSHLGMVFSDEHLKNLRLATVNRMRRNFGQVNPSYNPLACKIIDEYGQKNGYNFQHAENGGEFYIKDLGYWVDGYDKEKNVVIEIDEKHHFDASNNLKKKDIRRQKEIKQHLKCKFIRLKFDDFKFG